MRSKSLAVALFALLVGCDGVTENGTTRLSIYLTDAPRPEITEAWVQIDDIYLQGEGGRVTLRDGVVYSGDLLTLANDVEELVRDAVIPEGNYSQVRFVMPAACISVENVGVFASSDAAAVNCTGERVGSLQMPSFATAGFKVNLPAEAGRLEGADNGILLDFVVAESFGKQAGQSGKWVMHPVVKATAFSAAASVQVDVTLGEGVTLPEGTSLADFSAQLSYPGETTTVTETLPLSDPDGDGIFSARFRYLIPGTFTVDLVQGSEAIESFASDAPKDVTPAAGEKAVVEIEVTGVTGS